MSSERSDASASGRGPRGLSRRRLFRSIGALAGTATVLGLAACGPAPAPTPTPAPKPAAPAATTAPAAAPTQAPKAAAAAPAKEQIKLTWWNNQPMARTKGLWEAVVQDIETAYPNVKIDTVIIPFADFEPKVMTGLAGKNIGEIVDVHPVHAFTFAMRGALVDLNPYMKELGFPESDFTPAWKYNLWKGKYWAIPRSDNPTVILYNKKMILDAGQPDPYALYKEKKWDIATMDKIMAAVSKGEGDKRVYGSTPLGGNTLRLQCIWIWGNNGEIWNPDETEALFASDEALKAWEYQASYTKSKWAPTPAEINIPGGSVALMGQRRLISDMSGAQFVLGGQAQFLPEEVQKEMHLVAMYRMWNGKNEIRNATNAQGIYPDAKYRDEAWKAQAVTLTENTQKKIMEARWTSPLRKTWLKSDMWVKSLNPSFEGPDIWEDAVLNVRYHSHLPRYVEIDALVQKSNQEVILGQKPVKQAMTEAKAAVDKILQEVAEEAKNSPYLK